MNKHRFVVRVVMPFWYKEYVMAVIDTKKTVGDIIVEKAIVKGFNSFHEAKQYSKKLNEMKNKKNFQIPVD